MIRLEEVIETEGMSKPIRDRIIIIQKDGMTNVC